MSGTVPTFVLLGTILPAAFYRAVPKAGMLFRVRARGRLSWWPLSYWRRSRMCQPPIDDRPLLHRSNRLSSTDRYTPMATASLTPTTMTPCRTILI